MRKTRAIHEELSWRELFVLIVVTYGFFVLVVAGGDNYSQRILHAGDNSSYALESAVIRGVPGLKAVARHFLGYPLAVAPVAALLHIDDAFALAIVSAVFSIVAIVLAAKLWGTWAAALFAVSNFDWIQRSLLGGAEPLFAAIVFASLLAAREGRWAFTATLGGLATVVRPLGAFVLLAAAVVLLCRRRFGAFLLAIGISVVIGASYLALMSALFGQPTANLEWYRKMGLGQDPTFVPFVTLFASFHHHLITGNNIAKTLVWMTVTFAGIVAAMARHAIRASMRENPVEWLFAALYLMSFLALPAWWIEGNYARYLVPVIPMLFVALRPWLPSDRRVIWAIGLTSTTFAAIKDMPFFSRFTHML